MKRRTISNRVAEVDLNKVNIISLHCKHGLCINVLFCFTCASPEGCVDASVPLKHEG